VVIAKDKASRRDSVYAVDPRTAAATLLSDTGLWIDVDPMFVDRGHGPLVLTGHTDRMDTNLFRLDMARASGARPPTQETRYKMELLQRRFPEARVLTWRTASGAFGGGVLYVPPGMPPGRKVPLVLSVHTPGDWTSQIDRWAAKGPQSVQDDILMSMKDGIAFLTPDVPMSDYGVYDHPMRQVVEGVQAAVDAALATGFIDADRLGIVGKDSFTPHQSVFVVESVLTQTDRFKVAVCSNLKPTSTNWVGDYGPTHKEYFELGQGRFAVPLWDDPGRYLENSPIAYWNRVKTPILYINGDDQTYSGLIRLGLTGVNAGSRESYQEKDIRIRAWLREHFFGDKPTVQKADIPSFFFGAPEDNDPQ
jgi:dipeptidyl aminopeptidase/acylaminoacyl peptidase